MNDDSAAVPEDSEEPLAAHDLAWPPTGVAWYAVAVMVLSTMSSQLDLGIVSLLVPSIKKDLHITDFRMSLVLGFAFAVFYTLIGLPIARYIDRNSRKLILALGIATWSFGTALCGIAQNYWQLFAARVFVGAGESINGPACYSLIADFFPRERLPRAIAVLNLGTILGSGLALVIGAFVINAVLAMPDRHVAGIGVIHGWQLVFLLVGLPGLLIALLTAVTVREPARRGFFASSGRINPPLRDVVAYVWRHWAVFGPMFMGLAVGSLAFGNLAWMPTFYMRTFGWSPARVGAITGLLSLVVMPIGLVIGVWLAERFAKQGRDDAALRVVLIGRLVFLPAPIIAPLMPNPWLAITFSLMSLFAVGITGPSQNAALQIVTPNQMRGQLTALYLFVYSVVGTGIGPSVVAAVTDFGFHAESMLRYSLAICAAVVGPLSLLIMWLGFKPYAREVGRLKVLEA